MNKIEKIYKQKSSAKRALKKIFGVGIYANNYTHAEAKFCTGDIENVINEGYKLILKSNYFTENSLQRAFKIGIDNI